MGTHARPAGLLGQARGADDDGVDAGHGDKVNRRIRRQFKPLLCQSRDGGVKGVSTNRRRATGGAGLGLSIAREIAEGEGGTLTLANRAGGGLDAVIALPVRG